MRIAILSDTHGRETWVRYALQHAANRAVDLILHCGDIDDAATARLFPAHTHFVYGNCDYYRDEIRSAIEQVGATLHEGFGLVEAEGSKLAFVHGDDKRQLHDLIASDAFDFVFYGHTHVAEEHRVGKTRVINPGALHRVATKSFIILDLPSGSIDTIALG
jgi:putative phosphoesterase